jgi:hypothetical protein
MKPIKSDKKLGLKRITIANLSSDELRNARGGMLPGDGGGGGAHTASVCGGQCCDTDQFTNCASRPGICW